MSIISAALFSIADHHISWTITYKVVMLELDTEVLAVPVQDAERPAKVAGPNNEVLSIPQEVIYDANHCFAHFISYENG